VRLLVLSTGYPRWPGDHAGAFVAASCRHLAARGHSIRVIAPADQGRPLPHPAAAFRYAPAPIERLFYHAGVPENLAAHPALAALIPAATASMLAHALAACLAQRPDRIIAHWMVPCGAIARVVGTLLNIPVRMIGHSGDVHLLSKLPDALTRWLTHGARVATVSQPLADRLAIPPDLVLPMGFDPLPVQPIAERRDWLWMGRLVPIKAPEDAIRAFSLMLDRLPASAPRPHLHLAGDGPLRDECARLIRALGVPATRHGFLDAARLAPLMSRCAVSLWSSKIMEDGRHEGTPVSLLECAAAGLVPLVAQLPGTDWLLDEPVRQTLPARDLDGWADLMAATALDPDLRERAQRAAQRALPLAWSALIPRWERFIA
jgi:glycosyltransferase involved in cell wall biosynthesis